jgi:hypothetical protein
MAMTMDGKNRIMIYGPKERWQLSKWLTELKLDCPKRDGRLTDRCDLICPDLPKVL